MHIATEFTKFRLPARCLFICLLFIYLFVAHSTTLAVAYTIWRRMPGGYYNNNVERFIRNPQWPELM